MCAFFRLTSFLEISYATAKQMEKFMTIPTGSQVNQVQIDYNKVKAYAIHAIPLLCLFASHLYHSATIAKLDTRLQTIEKKGLTVSDVTGAISDAEAVFRVNVPSRSRGATGVHHQQPPAGANGAHKS